MGCILLIIALYLVIGCVVSAIFDVICRLEKERIDLFIAMMIAVVWPVWLVFIAMFALSKVFAMSIWKVIGVLHREKEEV